LEELEVTIIRKSNLLKDNDAFRIDSEFNLKAYLAAAKAVQKNGAEKFEESNPSIIHPQEIVREYTEENSTSVWFFRAQNLRPMRIDVSNKVYISSDDAVLLAKNKLIQGDVLITRTGANRGDCAYFNASEDALASSHTFIVRSERWRHPFLVAFLNSRYGRLQIDKGVYGGAQPEVAPYYLRKILIPTVSNYFQDIIAKCFVRTIRLHQEAMAESKKAEKTLLRALGLEGWQPPEPLTYTRRASETFVARRLDAEYFSPRVKELVSYLGKDDLNIADVANSRKEHFDSRGTGDFNYIEISNVLNDGTAASELMSRANAPSRATWHVHNGDVITSMVRPIRRLSAQITQDQDGFVVSSGFVVLRPVSVSSELLLTYLRLPLVCELMDLHTSASMYPAISEQDLLNIPFCGIDFTSEHKIIQCIRKAQRSRSEAQLLLERAKHAVEIAIEQHETVAIDYLNEARIENAQPVY
jgi:hypothetical protein